MKIKMSVLIVGFVFLFAMIFTGCGEQDKSNQATKAPEVQTQAPEAETKAQAPEAETKVIEEANTQDAETQTQAVEKVEPQAAETATPAAENAEEGQKTPAAQ